jgi:hypothetical protein
LTPSPSWLQDQNTPLQEDPIALHQTQSLFWTRVRMDDNSTEISLPKLLLKLQDEEFTGTVTIRDHTASIKFFLKKGRMIYADGADKSSDVIDQIASERKLNQTQINEIQAIAEDNPYSLGKNLIDRKIISKSDWNHFIETKIKDNTTYALGMKEFEVSFDVSQPDIPPINRYTYNILQLIPDAVRNIKQTEFVREALPDEEVIPFKGKRELISKVGVFLTTSEQKILAMVDGEKDLKAIREHSWILKDEFDRCYYLLQCMGIIEYPHEKTNELDDENEYTMIANLYIDLLRIIQQKFQKEVGQEFKKIFSNCLEKLPVHSKDILRNLDLSPELQMGVVRVISKHFTENLKSAENRLILMSSFNKILYPLILRMKKILGLGIAEATLNEMIIILQYMEKYQGQMDMAICLKENIEDYLKQIKE